MAYGSNTYSICYAAIRRYVAPVFIALYSALDAFFRAVMLVVPPFNWRTARDVSAAAYRKIGELKPVYRESYDTHGLSFSAGRTR